jgi:methylmalonyl-CoA mutase N-terminal domain/subunit
MVGRHADGGVSEITRSHRRLRPWTYPIVGVNTFRNPHADDTPRTVVLQRSTDTEKESQLERLADFHQRHAALAPAALAKLKAVVIENGNVFAELVNTVRVLARSDHQRAFRGRRAVPAEL